MTQKRQHSFPHRAPDAPQPNIHNLRHKNLVIRLLHKRQTPRHTAQQGHQLLGILRAVLPALANDVADAGPATLPNADPA